MSPSGTPKIRGSKRGAKALEGAERCPECGILQDWKDQYMILSVGEDEVGLWECHSCSHHFRIWRGGILKQGDWPEELESKWIRIKE